MRDTLPRGTLSFLATGALLALAALTGCRPSGEGKTGQAVPETPWEQVRQEAKRLETPGESLALKLQAKKADLELAALPVLAPEDAQTQDRLELTVKSHLYTALAVFKTHRVEVLGLRTGQQDSPDLLKKEKNRIEIEFARWGARYRVRIVCEGVPEPDLRLCQDEAAVRALRGSLRWLNFR